MHFRYLAISFLSLVFLLISCSALCPTNQSFSANSKYSYVGKFTIDVSSNLKSLEATDWIARPLSVTIHFPQPLINISVHAGVILQDYYANHLQQGLSANLIISSIKESNMVVNVSTSNAGHISKLAIGYFLIIADETYAFNFLVFPFQVLFQPAGRNISNVASSFCLQNIALPTTFNSTNCTIVGFLSGIYAIPINNASLIIDFDTSVNIRNNTMIWIQISSASQTPTIISQISYTFILYNQGGLNLLPNNLFFFQSGVVTTASQILFQFNFTSSNIYIGLYSFGRSVNNSFSFNISVGQNSISMPYGSGFSHIKSSYLAIYSKYCSYKTPYLYSAYELCFDNCPAATVSNSQLLQCSGVTTQTLQSAATTCSSQTSSNSSSIGLIIGLAVGAVVLISIFILIILKWKKRACFQALEQTNNANLHSAQSASRINNGDNHVVQRPGQQPNMQVGDAQAYILRVSNQSEKITQAKTAVTPFKQPQQEFPVEDRPIAESNEDINIKLPNQHPMRISNIMEDIYALQGNDNLSIIEEHQLQLNGEYHYYS